MGRPKAKRPVSCAITLGKDGRWTGTVTLGKRPDGRPRRVHRSSRYRDVCEDLIRAAEDEYAAHGAVQAASVPRLEQWLTTWLDTVVCDLADTTRRTYGWAVREHLIPGLGGHHLDSLQAKHIEALYRRIAKAEPDDDGGLAPASVHTVHRAIRASLNEAHRRGIMRANPMAAVRAPILDDEEISPLVVDEVRRIIEVCRVRRNGTRWIVGLSLGLRQGEILGLPWMRPSRSTKDHPLGLDLDRGVLVVRRQAKRSTWKHGCQDPKRCAQWKHGCKDPGECRRYGWECPKRVRRCRTKKCGPSWEHGCDRPERCHPPQHGGPNVTARLCPQRRQVPCRKHPGKKGCPPPCPKDCTGHASTCPDRTGGGIVMADPKSRAGRRRIRVPAELLQLPRQHRAQQSAERLHAGSCWEDHGLVWCQVTGRPVDASADRKEWKEILRLAGVRNARVHDGRHTAATMLLMLGVDARVVMSVMGWSDGRMVARYQHVVEELLEDVAGRLDGLLFSGSVTRPVTTPGLKIAR